MSWLNKIGFGKQSEATEGPRRLEHPRDLQLGDIVKFEFSAQAEINNRSFTVKQLWALSTGEGDHNRRLYYGLEDGAQKIRLRVVDDEMIEVGIELLPDDLLQIFKKGDLIDLFESEDELGILKRRKLEKVPESYHAWTAPLYRREGIAMAYRFEGDYRSKPLPAEEGAGEIGCDYHLLVSDDRDFSMEFRIFDGGRTEAHLSTRLPRRKIEELWPAG
jgi:hypothetical protein